MDRSGFPDLYCSVGGRRGTGVKANQLWLDPGTGDSTLDPVVGRAAEPLGRGRVATFLDADGDGQRDLFVGQETERMDGLPSDNRVYLRTAPARFEAVAGSGIDPTLAARSVSTGDVDADGSDDLLLVYSDEHALRRTGGVRLYHATGGRFRDVTSRHGIRSIGETDAELAPLDGDGRADLIQLSASRIRVSLKEDGRFHVVFERRIEDGVALAVGDVDGDGDLDIYVLRQKDRRGDDDVLLLNRDGAQAWRAIRVPSRPGGAADDVYPIDFDADGRTDFLALNGKDSTPGPGPADRVLPRLRARLGRRVRRDRSGRLRSRPTMAPPRGREAHDDERRPHEHRGRDTRDRPVPAFPERLEDDPHAAVPDHPERGEVAVAQAVAEAARDDERQQAAGDRQDRLVEEERVEAGGRDRECVAARVLGARGEHSRS